MNELIVKLIDAESSYIYDVEFTHPDYSPAFHRVFAQAREGISLKELGSPAYNAELARGIWNRYNGYGFYHEMKITLTLVLEGKPYTMEVFNGGLYDIAELEESARRGEEEEEE